MTGIDDRMVEDTAAVLQLLAFGQLDEHEDPRASGELYEGQAERDAAAAVESYRHIMANTPGVTSDIAIVSVLSGYAHDDVPDVVAAAVLRAVMGAERADRQAWSAAYRARKAQE